MANTQKKCPKGHYYDPSLAECPFCKPSTGFDEFPGDGLGDTGRVSSAWDTPHGWNQNNDDGKTTICTEEKDGEKLPPLVGWLVCTKGNEVGKDFRLIAGNNSVGRGSNQLVRLTDTHISREHFVVSYDPHHDIYYAFMEKGQAIVYLNGYPLSKNMVTIKKGDKFEVAGYTLVFIPLEKKDVSWEWS